MPKFIKSIVSNPSFIFAVIIYLSFLFHAINIGYNSPSNDEATYIKTGTEALFKGNWSLANTATWYGGYPFLYPTLTAMAFALGGIDASRILNTLFSVICLFFVGNLTLELSLNATKNRQLALIASYVAVILVGFSEVTGYLSRLATYDMPSFTFLTAALYFLIKGLNSQKTNTIAKRLLISSILLTLAFALKYIVAIYIPVILTLLWLYPIKPAQKNLKKLLAGYFVFPLILQIAIITLSQASYLEGFVGGQLIRESSTYFEIFRVFIIETWTAWIFWTIGLVTLLFKRRWKTVLIFVSFAAAISLFHFLTSRLATWDKHLFLVILPMGIMSGLGISYIFQGKVWGKLLTIILLIYVILSLNNGSRYNKIWPDYTNAYNFLEHTLQETDTLLSEEATSNLLNANITTFDWISYNNQTGEPAYKRAIIDGYFNYIELTEGYPVQTGAYKKIEALVQNEARGSYYPVYKDNYFTIYKLKF